MAGPAAPVVWGTAPTRHGECWCRAGAPWDRGAVVGIGSVLASGSLLEALVTTAAMVGGTGCPGPVGSCF